MPENKYLGAYTPTQADGGYHFYPPFVNFTQHGDKVRIMVRSTDELNEEKGWHETKSHASMDICSKEFKKLLENALLNLEI